MSNLINDVKFALRQLRKNPGFTTIAVLTLALGIGANSAIFSVVNSVLLRPLPYPESERLMWFSEVSPNIPVLTISYPNYLDYKEQQTVFDHIGVYNLGQDYNLSGLKIPRRLQGALVSSDTLNALSVQPILGRLFTEEDDRPGAQPTALLSYESWQKLFSSDPEIVSKSIVLNQQIYTVIGVMPKRFTFPIRSEVWTPIGLMANKSTYSTRANHSGLFGLARLKPGVTLEQARKEMENIAIRLEKQYPDSNEKNRIRIEPLIEIVVGNIRTLLWTLLGAVAIVLLISCINIANLLLARSMARKKEMGVRAILGAGRWRIVRQLLTESLLLASVGGVLGWFFAYWGLELILNLGTGLIPRIEEVHIENRVLLFTAIVTILTGILFGLAPAWQSSCVRVQDALKHISRRVIGIRSRLRQGLVIAEIALTLLLLAGGGLMLRSFYYLRTVDTVYNHERVLSFRLNLSEQKYTTGQEQISFCRNLISKLREVPGVQTAAFSYQMPLNKRGGWSTPYQIEGQSVPDSGDPFRMEINVASSDYFRTLGIPILQGRAFTEQDNLDHLRNKNTNGWSNARLVGAGINAIIVDEEFAKRHWPNENPIGRQVRLLWGKYLGEGFEDPMLTVVGVVPRVRMADLNDTEGFVQTYLSAYQVPNHNQAVIMKMTLPPEALKVAIQQQVATLDPDQPIYNLRTLDELRDSSLSPQRLNLVLFVIFGTIALLLALIGLYGVLAYTVSQRLSEIGIRIALGAQRSDVLQMILRQGLQMTGIGVGVGLVGAFALTRLLRGMVFGITPTDPVTFIGVSLLILAVALLACYLPARRAAKVDPMEALRYE